LCCISSTTGPPTGQERTPQGNPWLTNIGMHIRSVRTFSRGEPFFFEPRTSHERRCCGACGTHCTVDDASRVAIAVGCVVPGARSLALSRRRADTPCASGEHAAAPAHQHAVGAIAAALGNEAVCRRRAAAQMCWLVGSLLAGKTAAESLCAAVCGLWSIRRRRRRHFRLALHSSPAPLIRG
jgi:hypothetical protein